jgi:hypothetical protein
MDSEMADSKVNREWRWNASRGALLEKMAQALMA